MTHPFPTRRSSDLVRKRPLDAGLSTELLDAAGKALDTDGQVLVFKNRRGYAPVLLCHDCGWSAQCKRCDAPMTVHAGGRRLQCHHCGARRPVPLACPDCRSEEHTSELQSLMRLSYAVFCLKKKKCTKQTP